MEYRGCLRIYLSHGKRRILTQINAGFSCYVGGNAEIQLLHKDQGTFTTHVCLWNRPKVRCGFKSRFSKWNTFKWKPCLTPQCKHSHNFPSQSPSSQQTVTWIQAPRGASAGGIDSLTCWRPVCLLHGPASELLRSDRLDSAGKNDDSISSSSERSSQSGRRRGLSYTADQTLGWGASLRFCFRWRCPVYEAGLQCATFFVLNHRNLKPSVVDTARDPSFSTFHVAGEMRVFIFRSSGGPHDPVRHRMHKNSERQTHSFTPAQPV